MECVERRSTCEIEQTAIRYSRHGSNLSIIVVSKFEITINTDIKVSAASGAVTIEHITAPLRQDDLLVKDNRIENNDER